MTDTEAKPTTLTVTIDGRPVECRPGELVIAAAERHGVRIPRFCWHPRMTEVGMCRMCLVNIDSGRGPALQPSCMVPVADGMAVDTTSPNVKKAQDGILEFLLINHPLDCPVCDKGGECPLQDQTLAHGPGETRFVEQKRHFAKPIPVSRLVQLDRERCVLCDRCTRFADEVAGDPLIHFLGRGNQTQVNTFPDHPFSSYFSGNTVQLCPVGALTASSYRFKARPWDLEESESTCTRCSVGCRVAVQSTRNEVVRMLGVDTDPFSEVTGDDDRLGSVNHGWLCDAGRYSVESLSSPDRLGVPLVRSTEDPDLLVEASWSGAIGTAATSITDAIQTAGPSSVAVLGGARLTNEAAHAWSQLARTVIGTDNVDAQLGDGLPADVVLGLPPATLDDACGAATLVWIGPDPKEELPVAFLRLRTAVRAQTVRVVEVSPIETSLTPLAKVSLRHRVGEASVAVRAVLGARGGGDVGATGGVVPAHVSAAAELLDAGGPIVIAVGRQSLAESPEHVVDAVLSLRDALPEATFLPLLRRGNVMGALEQGLSPGLLPGRLTLADGREHWSGAWGAELPEQPGLDATGILEAAAAGRIKTLVLVGSDPLGDAPDRDLAQRALAGAEHVIAVDTFVSASTARADVVLAAAGFGETAGTTTNLEGRVTQLSRRVTPPGTAREDWMIAAELALALGGDLGFETADELTVRLTATVPGHDGLGALSPGADATRPIDAPHLVDGALVGRRPPGSMPSPVAPGPVEPLGEVPVDAYSLRLVSPLELYDDGVTVGHSPHLAPLARGGVLRLSPYDFERLGVGAGTEVSARSSHGSVVVPAAPDARVPAGVAVLAARQRVVDAGGLVRAGDRLTEIRVESMPAPVKSIAGGSVGNTVADG